MGINKREGDKVRYVKENFGVSAQIVGGYVSDPIPKIEYRPPEGYYSVVKNISEDGYFIKLDNWFAGSDSGRESYMWRGCFPKRKYKKREKN